MLDERYRTLWQKLEILLDEFLNLDESIGSEVLADDLLVLRMQCRAVDQRYYEEGSAQIKALQASGEYQRGRLPYIKAGLEVDKNDCTGCQYRAALHA